MNRRQCFRDSLSTPKFWNKLSDAATVPVAPAEIKNIQLVVLSASDIRKQSVCQIETTTLYERSLPRAYGINDIRMGTVDRKLRCGTCLNNMVICNGHTGHIELPMPVYHISYISDLVKLLRCICPHCFRNVCGPSDSNSLHLSERFCASFKERYFALCNYAKTKKVCGQPDCLGVLPKYNQQGFTIKREWPGIAKKEAAAGPFTPQLAHDLLEMVDDSVFIELGLHPQLTHPCSFILKALVVPPPIIRPSIMFSESCRTRGQDDLTHKLQEILKQCQKLRTSMDDQLDTSGAFELLQAQVATYMNNETAGAKLPSKKRSGQPEKCVVKRLKGKRGRFRGNLMGKRVDFTARTVISPDCVMDVDEIGIPMAAALKLTFVEVVNRLNIAQLQQRVFAGAGVIHGAKSITKDNGQAVSLEMCQHRDNIRLQIGWSVERYMQNGDTVLFNRQPSLRKKSMMAHTVKLMPGNTFRLNLCCTGPYNGDFDGDEMNLHMLQRLDAVVEAKQLMSVSNSLLNAQSNKPCMGIVQDSLVGAYLLTQPGVFLSREAMCQLMMHIKYPFGGPLALPIPAILKPVPLWTGKQAMSLILPPICLVKKDVTIRYGHLLQGTLCKQTLGATSGGIIDVTCKMIDNETALRFMSDCQRLVNSWMEEYGFSVGISDCLIDAATQQKIDGAVDACLAHIAKVEAVGKSLSIPFKYREGHVSSILSKMLNVTGGLVQEQIKPDNALMAMVTAGSKGNPINISQISGCVGQQSIEGHRIFDEDNPTDRTLACFPHGADTAVSRGFVRHSYIKGLSPAEVFFHAMGGREGIVDTSVKTADTGYLQRRIVKALESITIEYDQTVRESSGNIVEYRYGGDNCDAAYLDKVSMSFLTLTRQQLALDCGAFPHELPPLVTLIQDCLSAKITLLSTQLSTDAHLPVNIVSILSQLKPDKTGPRVTADIVGPAVTALLERLRRLEEQTLFLRANLAYHLRSHELVTRLRLSMDQFQCLLTQIQRHHQRAQVSPGEMVGVLAAESVGEPCTQLTLNTFHHAGVAEKNVTLGVPRIKELIDARYVNQTPSTDLFIRAPFSTNKRFVDKFKETLPETYLKDVMQSFDVLLDPDVQSTSVCHEADQFLLRAWQQFGAAMPTGASRYVIRIVLNRELLTAKELSVADVQRLIIKKLPGRDMYHILASEPNMRDWIIRIRMCGMSEMRQHAMNGCKQHTDQLVLEFEKNMAHAFLKYISRVVHICGVKGVDRATVQQQTTTRWDENTLEKTETTEYYVQTSGVNLRGFWNIEVVDWKRCISNSVFEVLELLGIEATAVVLFHEIKTVLSFDGCYVNNRHIMMIVNIMTRTGCIMPMNRHGLNRLEVGPLVKCTFEETVDIIFEAGLFGENNPVTSISDSIMVGQPIPGGTGKMELFLDETYERSTKVLQKDTKSTTVIRTFYSEFAHAAERSKKRKNENQEPAEQSKRKQQMTALQNFEHSSTSLFCVTSPAPNSPTYHPSSPSYQPTPSSPSATSPTYHPSSPSPTSPSYHPTPSSPSATSPTWYPEPHSLSLVHNKYLAPPVADEKYVLDYACSSASVTDIEYLESGAVEPIYAYHPSTPLLGEQRAPNSPRLSRSAQQTTGPTTYKTIQETLQVIVPRLLSAEIVSTSTAPVLYHPVTGELDLQALQAAVQMWSKEL